MRQISVGDVIICNDVLGAVIEIDKSQYTVLLKDGTHTKLNKSANIEIVANAYSIAALIYHKVLKKMWK